MKKKPAKPSPAIMLLDHVWEFAMKGCDHSWERLNHTMRDALLLAIGGGLVFEPGDFSHIRSNYRSGYWIGESDEWCYAMAVACCNPSAVASFERYKNRSPFIADDVSPKRSEWLHMTGSRVKERLAVNSTFPWKGKTVIVTSFAEDGKSLTACSYKPRIEDDYSNKVEKRFTITIEDIRVDRAERKRRGELMKELSGLAKDKPAEWLKDVLAKLGAKTNAEYDLLPVSKIEKVAAEVRGAA